MKLIWKLNHNIYNVLNYMFKEDRQQIVFAQDIYLL